MKLPMRFLTKLAKTKEVDEESYSTPFTRLVQGGFGLGMMRGNAPTAAAHMAGSRDLWHGTEIENMGGKDGILTKGLSTEHAGKNKRLNNVLTSNAFVRDTEDFLKSKGVAMTPEIEQTLFNYTAGVFDPKKSDGTPAHKKIISNAKDLAGKLGLDPQELHDFYKSREGEFGKRLYFGGNPQGVAFWGNKQKNELSHMAERQMNKQGPNAVKNVAEGLASQFTGGVYDDVVQRRQYGSPTEKLRVKDHEELRNMLKGVDRDRFTTVFRSSVPTGTVGAYKDLPGIRHAIASMPFLKHIVGDFLPQSDPAKDLSIAENVPGSNINRVHLVDKHTGKVHQQIDIDNHTKTPKSFFGGKGRRWTNFKSSLIPAAATLGGGYMLADAVRGNNPWPWQEKTSAYDKAHLAKLLLAPGLVSAGAAGAMYGTEKAFDIDRPPVVSARKMEDMSFRDQLRQQAKELKYSAKMALPAVLGGTLSGAGIGALIAKKNRGIGAALGAGIGGYMSGSLATSLPQQMTLMQTRPQTSGLLGLTAGQTDTGKNWIKNNPMASATAEAGLQLGLLTGLPYYAGRKFYPYHFLKAKNVAMPKYEEFADKLLTSPKSKLMLAGMGVVPGLLSAGMVGAGSAAAGQALESSSMIG